MSNWHYNKYVFVIDWHSPYYINRVCIRAKTLENAIKIAKKMAKEYNGEYIGPEEKYDTK